MPDVTGFSKPALEVVEVFFSGLDLFLLLIIGADFSSELEEELELGDVLEVVLPKGTFITTFFVLPTRSVTLGLLLQALELLISQAAYSSLQISSISS